MLCLPKRGDVERDVAKTAFQKCHSMTSKSCKVSVFSLCICFVVVDFYCEQISVRLAADDFFMKVLSCHGNENSYPI